MRWLALLGPFILEKGMGFSSGGLYEIFPANWFDCARAFALVHRASMVACTRSPPGTMNRANRPTGCSDSGKAS
jgi:hypothetical protein